MQHDRSSNRPAPDVRVGTLALFAPDGVPAPQTIWCVRLDGRIYLAAAPGSVAERYLEEDGRTRVTLGDPAEGADIITGIAVPVLTEDEQQRVLDRLAARAPEPQTIFHLSTEPLVPPELIEDPAERRLLVQSMFSNLPPHLARAMVHQLHYETYEAGALVIRQDTAADRFFIVVEGQVEVLEVRAGDEQLVTVLGPGESFGESALLLNTARTANVRARTPLRVLSLDRHTFEQVLLLSTEADTE